MRSIDKLLAGLNQNQREAVIDTEGPSLIVAGAGSGKTKVLTTKLAYIISEKKAWSNQILCVTFTNKAAREMQNRIINNLKNSSNSLPWLGTFHSISVKILRRHAEALGYKSNFTILDTDDQKKLLKKILESENIDLKKVSPQFVVSFIDKWKAFGWNTFEVDGHNHSALINILKKTSDNQPTCIIAHTIKGKGVSFMENNNLWHYRSPSKEDLELALREIDEN